jgi:hypothetical protein
VRSRLDQRLQGQGKPRSEPAPRTDASRRGDLILRVKNVDTRRSEVLRQGRGDLQSRPVPLEQVEDHHNEW